MQSGNHYLTVEGTAPAGVGFLSLRNLCAPWLNDFFLLTIVVVTNEHRCHKTGSRREIQG